MNFTKPRFGFLSVNSINKKIIIIIKKKGLPGEELLQHLDQGWHCLRKVLKSYSPARGGIFLLVCHIGEGFYRR